jgi:hypothetical protein
MGLILNFARSPPPGVPSSRPYRPYPPKRPPSVTIIPLKRREFITMLGGAAAWPVTAHAQQRAVPVIGVLSSRSPAVDTALIAVIQKGLNEAGLFEGQNVALDYRWAGGQFDRLPGLADELVRRQAAVIVTIGGDVSARAANDPESDDDDRFFTALQEFTRASAGRRLSAQGAADLRVLLSDHRPGPVRRTAVQSGDAPP